MYCLLCNLWALSFYCSIQVNILFLFLFEEEYKSFAPLFFPYVCDFFPSLAFPPFLLGVVSAWYRNLFLERSDKRALSFNGISFSNVLQYESLVDLRNRLHLFWVKVVMQILCYDNETAYLIYIWKLVYVSDHLTPDWFWTERCK